MGDTVPQQAEPGSQAAASGQVTAVAANDKFQYKAEPFSFQRNDDRTCVFKPGSFGRENIFNHVAANSNTAREPSSLRPHVTPRPIRGGFRWLSKGVRDR